MVTLEELKYDEEQAIYKYSQFLKQEPHSKKIIRMILEIKKDEMDHLKKLRSL